MIIRWPPVELKAVLLPETKRKAPKMTNICKEQPANHLLMDIKVIKIGREPSFGPT